VTGVILAGGQATRYGGRAKGLERVGGRRIIDRVADALRAVSDDLLLIANDAAAAQWLPGVRTASDVRPGLGSLGGIYSALVRAGTPVLVLAWDMPFVPVGLLSALRHFGEEGRPFAVPTSGSRRGVEPLCAYYGLECARAIERRLDAGDLRVVSFFDEVAEGARVDARAFGDPALMFMNVNTPDDLLLAERHASTTDGGRRRQEA
jgi:molybdopterin-guanine dinucleotide biosynthesis protein A